jgi:hypothetical protein
MTPERKVRWIVVAVVVVVVIFFLLSERVEETLAPEPQRAWIAIEVAGSGTAATGRQQLESGTRFTLHAVLEARTLAGRTIYYTDAPGLRIRGEEVPVEALRKWTRNEEVRILWFTVEGFTPYFEVAPNGLAPGRFPASSSPLPRSTTRKPQGPSCRPLARSAITSAFSSSDRPARLLLASVCSHRRRRRSPRTKRICRRLWSRFPMPWRSRLVSLG